MPGTFQVLLQFVSWVMLRVRGQTDGSEGGGDAKLLLVTAMEEGSCRGRDKGGRESQGEMEEARRRREKRNEKQQQRGGLAVVMKRATVQSEERAKKRS